MTTGWPWFRYTQPRSRIVFAILFQVVALAVVLVGGRLAICAAAFIAGTIGLLIGFLRDTGRA